MDEQRKPTKFFLFILFSILIVCALGVCLGIYYANLPENNPQRDQPSCEQAGGEWNAGEGICLISNRPAGAECTDGGQCQSGVCFPPELDDEQYERINNREIITNITGTCYQDEMAEGCVKQVIRGSVSLESLCYE